MENTSTVLITYGRMFPRTTRLVSFPRRTRKKTACSATNQVYTSASSIRLDIDVMAMYWLLRRAWNCSFRVVSVPKPRSLSEVWTCECGRLTVA